MMSKLGIYVHIPFCESKCLYCDFASFSHAENSQEEYFKSLISEIETSPYKGREVDTVYIGGGTPSCVEPSFIEKILNVINQNFIIDETAEISMECNPNSVDKERLKQYKSFGINRISFGVQSLHNEELKAIGRLHNKQQALDAINLANRVGFKNINADLMLGLPNATTEKVLEDAEILTQSGVTHISAYMLQVEEGTPLFNIVKRNPEFLPSDDESVIIYEKLANFLEKNGFLRYEISNFALKGFECKHNLKYWACKEYLGFGLSAHSYIDGKRIANSKNFEEYFARRLEINTLTAKDEIEERIMLGLRCKLGFSVARLQQLGYDITKNDYYNKFLKEGILTFSGDIVNISPKYYGVSNYVIVNLLP